MTINMEPWGTPYLTIQHVVVSKSDTSAGGLLVPEGIIRPVVSASALSRFNTNVDICVIEIHWTYVVCQYRNWQNHEHLMQSDHGNEVNVR
jgi:hypothetical protein